MSVLDKFIDLTVAVGGWLLAIGLTILEYPDARAATSKSLLDQLVRVEVDDTESDLVLALVEMIVQDSNRSHDEAENMFTSIGVILDRGRHCNHPDGVTS